MSMNFVEITALIVFLIGFYGLIARRNIIKSILSLGVMDIGVILFFLGIRFDHGAHPPVGAPEAPVADPVPQAMMITAIVIGIAVTAAALMMFIALYHRYGSTNWDTVRGLRTAERKK